MQRGPCLSLIPARLPPRVTWCPFHLGQGSLRCRGCRRFRLRRPLPRLRPVSRPVTVPSGSQPALGFSDPDPFVNEPPPGTRWAPSSVLAGHSDSDDEPRPVPRPGRAAVGKGRQRRAESASARVLWTLPPRGVTVSPDKPRSFWDAVKARLSEAEDESLLGGTGRSRSASGEEALGVRGGKFCPRATRDKLTGTG